MKIITWNCNGAFRKKYKELEELNPDILIIQECEDPGQSKDNNYKAWSKNYIWVGQNKHKGLGVFCKPELHLKQLKWETNNLQLFLPCRIKDQFNLLAVWTKQANSPNFAYIGQLWKFLQLHKEKLSDNKSFVIGDFNSNKIWDEWDRWWNHSDVVKELREIGIESAYHFHFNEAQGNETTPTLFMNRNQNKAYHIDYIFCPTPILRKSLFVEVGKPEKWLTMSDHMPVLMQIDF